MIIFTKHAKDRLIERGISEKQIESVIANPDYAGRAFDNKLVARKKIGTKTVEIVYAVEGNNIIIITCYLQ